MLDTNIFDHIKKGNIDTSKFENANFFVTHIQQDEIQATTNTKIQEELNCLFKNIIKTKLPTESFHLGTSLLGEAKLSEDPMLPTESAIFGISKYGKAKYTSKDNKYSCRFIKSALDRKKKHKNNLKDALIAETAIKNGLILVTDDKNLFDVITECGGSVQNLTQLLSDLEQNILSTIKTTQRRMPDDKLK